MNPPQLELAPDVAPDVAETTVEYARRMLLEAPRVAPEDCPGCGAPTKHGSGARCQSCLMETM